MPQPRTLVVGSVHLKIWWLNIVKGRKRPGPTIGAPQKLVCQKNMHHSHNCSIARFNPKGGGNKTEQEGWGIARCDQIVKCQDTRQPPYFCFLITPSIPLLQSHVICEPLPRTIFCQIVNLQGWCIQRFLDLRSHDVFRVAQTQNCLSSNNVAAFLCNMGRMVSPWALVW